MGIHGIILVFVREQNGVRDNMGYLQSVCHIIQVSSGPKHETKQSWSANWLNFSCCMAHDFGTKQKHDELLMSNILLLKKKKTS